MQPLLSAFNQLLTHNDSARDALRAYVDKRVRLSVGPLDVFASITENGYFAQVAAPSTVEPSGGKGHYTPDLSITVPLAALPYAAQGKDALGNHITVNGNVGLAKVISSLLPALPLMLEAQTEKWVGPVIAHRIARAGERLRGLAQGFVANGTESVRRFVQDERAPVVGEAEFASHRAEVAELSRKVDALALSLKARA